MRGDVGGAMRSKARGSIAGRRSRFALTQVAFKLGEAAQHREHEPPVRGHSVRPRVGKGTKARALVGYSPCFKARKRRVPHL
jgi:hypothetical protein